MIRTINVKKNFLWYNSLIFFMYKNRLWSFVLCQITGFFVFIRFCVHLSHLPSARFMNCDKYPNFKSWYRVNLSIAIDIWVWISNARTPQLIFERMRKWRWAILFVHISLFREHTIIFPSFSSSCKGVIMYIYNMYIRIYAYIHAYVVGMELFSH